MELLVPFPPDLEAEALGVLQGWRPEREQHERPATIGAMVVKTVAGCNLDCDYCYEYRDDSWKAMPARMSEETAQQVGERIGEYADQNELKTFSIIYHGGEPLLAPLDYYDRITDILRRTIHKRAASTTLSFGMQTNGTLLTARRLQSLRNNGISVAVSLDGEQEDNDQHRIMRASRQGSYRLAEAGLNRLRHDFPEIYLGILSVADITRPGWANGHFLYEHIKTFKPPSYDLLLPYGTHDDPPPRPEGNTSVAPYFDLLLRPVVDIWWKDPERLNIRLFNSITKMLLGGNTSSENIGTQNGSEITVRTNGTYERVDALSIIDKQAVVLEKNIFAHSLEQVAVTMRREHSLGAKALSEACQACPFDRQDICGGGHIATRYSKAKGYDNTSVYCEDLARLIGYIEEKVNRQLQHAALAGRGDNPSVDWLSMRAYR